MANTFTPFDQVTVEITDGDITYTVGGTVIRTYEVDSTAMCDVSLMDKTGVQSFEETNVTAVS